MGLKRTIVKLLVHKLAPRIFRRLAPGFLGRFAPRLLGGLAPQLVGKSSGRYGYAKYHKPKSRGWLGGLKKLLKKLT